MMKAILGQDIKVGDTIDAGGGLRGKVLKYLRDDLGGKHYELDIGHLSFLSGDIVGLLHRPPSEGKTEEDMLQAVDVAVANLWLGRVAPEAGRIAVREAIEAWELGKPLAEEP